MEIEVCVGAARYPYVLGTDCIEQITARLLGLSASRYLVISDSNTGPYYGEDIAARLSARAPVTMLGHEAGEASKTLAQVGALAEAALAGGADRASVIVAVGGGVTGNIAGLVAALLFRGIRLAHVPTSLIAMLDSVLSLKQAINSRHGKNLIGTFYPPELVLADTRMLRTLPPREITSGLCEAIKNALAVWPALTGTLLDSLDPSGAYHDAALRTVIAENVRAKMMVTARDEHECRAGLVLEYGHTVGHALEFTAAGALSHGEAVGLGMLAAAEVSRRLGHLDDATVQLHHTLLRRANAPVTIPAGLDLELVCRRLRFDNKRGYLRGSADESVMVLLRGPGEPIWSDGRPLVPVPMSLLGEVIGELAGPPGAPAGRLALVADDA